MVADSRLPARPDLLRAAIRHKLFASAHQRSNRPFVGQHFPSGLDNCECSRMRNLPFERLEHGEYSKYLSAWQHTGSWWAATIQGEAFEVACGLLDPFESLGVFRPWIETSAVR